MHTELPRIAKDTGLSGAMPPDYPIPGIVELVRRVGRNPQAFRLGFANFN